MTAIEKLLIISEGYIRNLFEAIPIPIYAWQYIGNDFILIDYNQIKGLASNNIFNVKIGSKASNIFKKQTEILELFRICLRNQESLSREIKYPSGKNYKYLFLKFNFIPENLILLYVEDITEKIIAKRKLIGINEQLEQNIDKQTQNLESVEQDLRKSEERYRLILENAGAVVWSTDMNVNLTYVSANSPKILGYTVEEAMSIPINIRLTPQSLAKVINILKEEFKIERKTVKDLNRSRTFETEQIHKNGSIIPVEMTITFLRDKNGNATGILGVSRDISERKLAEIKLRDSELRYRELYEEAPNAYFSIKPDKSIISCNKAATMLLGYSKEEILNMKVTDLYANTEEGITKAKKAFQKFLNGKEIKDEELQMKKKNGDIIWISLSVKPMVDSSGKVIESRSMIIDINKRKNAEIKLKESEKRYHKAYDLVNFYKDVFTHDINNILQIINSSAELIFYQNRYSKNALELQKVSETIKKQVKRGAKLIYNIRTLSELDEKKMKLESLDACQILRNSIDFIIKAYPEKDINISINCRDDTYLVQANELLHDVFDNILINAIKYNENKKIEVLINIFEEIKERKKNIRFEFIDNGMGIINKKKKILFKRGYRKVKDTKGMGLGLSLVYKIIKNYDGKIWVEDKVAGDYTKGSKFIILLPKFYE